MSTPAARSTAAGAWWCSREVEDIGSIASTYSLVVALRLGRTCPDLEVRLFFDPDEIRGTYLFNKLRHPPNPSLYEVMRMIARVGGFLGRKRDGEPGAKTLWEGLRDVCASALTLQASRELDD